MQPKKISSVVLLVHPLFSIASYGIAPTKKARFNAKLLLGLWGKQIKRASAQPNSLVVIVAPPKTHEHWAGFERDKKTGEVVMGSRRIPLRTWADPSLGRFLEFARRELGERLFVENRKIGPEALRKKIDGAGFRLDSGALKGKSFGELWKHCVKDQAKLLAESLGMRASAIRKEPRLSAVMPNFYNSGKGRLLARPPEKILRHLARPRRIA